MSSTDFGEDWAADDDGDILPTLAEVDGIEALIQALQERLSASFLFYDHSYGFDLDALLNDDVHARVLEQRIVSQLEQDERVNAVAAKVTVTESTGAVDIEIYGTANVGPFRFVLRYADLALERLREE